MIVWFCPYITGPWCVPEMLPVAAPLDVEASDTIRDVKSKIRLLRAPPTPPVRLFVQLFLPLNSRQVLLQELDDDRTLSDYFIGDRDIITIFGA